jgi:glycosyltransferase involved in cell wall biosynthesis
LRKNYQLPVKILFIHNRYKQFGGEDVAVELETSILIKKGHEVKTLFFDNAPIIGVLSKIAAAFHSVYNFTSARKVSKTILQFKPDIIHVHNLFFIASPSVIYAANKYKIPVILTFHNYRLICANALLLRNNEICELCTQKTFPLAGIRYKCYRNSATESAVVTMITGIHKLFNTWKNKIHTYIALNEFSRSKLLHSSLHIPESKMITKPNFAPDPGEGNMERESFFLFAGRIVKEKGVYTLAKAFTSIPESKIIIIGDGPEKKLLEEEFKSYPNIYFAGQIEKKEVNDYMKRCKAFICPSIWYEGAPLTIIEAFATGTPVIASRLGSMAESITDGFNGLHFSAGDANDLCEKIKIFITETENHSMFYKNARQTYLEKYHTDIHYSSILKIYEKALKEVNA